MRILRLFFLLTISVCLTLPGQVLAVPTPYAPGELLVKVRIPTVSRNKSGGTTYGIPPVLEQKIEAEGMLSAKSLAGQVDAALAKVGTSKNAKAVQQESTLKGVFLLKIDSGADVKKTAEKIAQIPGIEYAEPNYGGSLCRAPNDEYYEDNQRSISEMIGLEEAWEHSTGSPDVTIAVLDSGIDLNHPEFSDGRVLPGYNFVEDSTDVQDLLGHGTRVSGIIGARGNDGVGMAGVCWDCRLLPLIVAATDSQVAVADVIEAIEFAVQQGADVINMSLAIGAESQFLKAACNSAFDHAVLVAAAGNQGQNYVPLFPAGYDSVIGVASLDENGNRSTFSNYNLPGVNDFVDLAAPGGGVFTTIPGGLYDGVRSNGTSFSSPFVSGVAALLKASNPTQSPGAIRAHLERHAESIGPIVSKGHLDAAAALASDMVPLLRVAEVTIRDGKDLNPANDGDSALDRNETAEIVVELQNLGADLPSFPATLASSDPDITVSTSTATFPALSHGNTRKNLTQPFTIAVTGGTGQSNASLTLEIPGANPVPISVLIEDEVSVVQEIASDLILGPDYTWMISGLTTVATNATLSVQPGTTVKFNDDARLVVYGGLSSLGTADKHINWLNKTPSPDSLFAPSREFPVGKSPESVIAVDVTGDSVLDLVTGNGDDDDVSVLAGDGTGGFSPQVRFPVGEYPTCVIAADVTGDSVLDLITANGDDDDVSVLAGDGTGSFSPQARFPVGEYPTCVIAADVTGDSVLDLVTANRARADVSVLAGDGAGGFAPEVRFPVGHHPTSVIAADVTADSVLDLVTANSSDVSVLAGDGAGGFSPEVRFPVVGMSPESVIAADVTGDSVLDLVTVGDYSHDVSVLAGDGTGGFSPEARFPVGMSPRSVIAADVTGDSILDLVTANSLDFDVSMLAGDGAGGFSPEVRFPVGDRPVNVIAADLTGDSVLDLVTANNDSDDVSVLAGDGVGGFSPEVLFPVGRIPTCVIAADLTGDSVLDLVTANSWRDDDVSVLAGDGAGGFAPQMRFPVGVSPESVIAADVTGDSVLDLVTANQFSDDVSVLVGDGAGGFSPELRFSVGDEPVSVIAADVTGDSVLDLVTANQGSFPEFNGTVSVLAGDGAGGVAPEVRFLVGDNPTSVIAADVTGDSVLDLVTANKWDDDVSVLAGDGAGGFSPEVRFPVGDWPLSVIAADVTGDSVLDLVTANQGSFPEFNGTVSVLAGDGVGGFSQEVRFPVGEWPESVIAVDVTGDSVLDLVTANYSRDGDVSVLAGDGAGGFSPEVRFPVGDWPQSVIAADVTGDLVLDLVTANSYSDDVSVLVGDGAGGFSAYPSIRCNSSDIEIAFSEFSLPGQVVLSHGGEVGGSTFRHAGGPGLSFKSAGSVSDCTATNCTGVGFMLFGMESTAIGLVAENNRGGGIAARSILDSIARENDGSGIVTTVSIGDCLADLNDGIGLAAEESVTNSTSTRNTGHGISASIVENCLAASNVDTGIVATERVTNCTAIANGHGIQAPTIENSIVLGWFGSALSSEAAIDDSAILENASISTERIQFNNTIIADNAESATLDQIDGMYIAGNVGGGVDGIPVTNSTIIGNKGPGILNNVSVAGSNIVFNTGEGVVGGTILDSFVSGNLKGDLVAGATGSLLEAPVESAPAFLASVTIELSNRLAVNPDARPHQAIGVGGAEFIILSYSKDMDTTKKLWVTFGQSYPYTSFILEASRANGWIDDRSISTAIGMLSKSTASRRTLVSYIPIAIRFSPNGRLRHREEGELHPSQN